MCLACATPVRGKSYGIECLALQLGPDAPAPLEAPSRSRDATPRIVARLGFAVAAFATVLPWSRFGPGSDALGAWSRTARWSLVAGVLALAGLALVLAQRSPRLRTPAWDAWVTLLGAGVAIASILSVAFPQAFSRPWLGPWVAAAGGCVSCAATIVAGRATEPAAARL